MNYAYTTILVALFCLNTEGGAAQSIFKAGILAGANFSQIQGDRQEGYRKKGLSLGLTGSMIIKPRLDICTELLINEKGAEPTPEAGFRFNEYSSSIYLRYSEMAILAHYFFDPLADLSHYRQSVKIGFSYGRLLKSQTEISQKLRILGDIAQTLTDNYQRNDFSFVAAWSFHFSPRFSASLRHTTSLNFIYTSTPTIAKRSL